VSGAVVFFQAEDGIRDDLVTGVQTCALPICEDLGNVRERPPLEHGYVFDDARRSKARHRRAGGAPGLVEPAPTLLVERHERLAEQERQPAVGRFVDRHEVVMPATHRRELAVPHGAAHLPGAALTRRGLGVAVAARPAPGTSGPSTSTPIATCLIGVPP